ncbi:MAG: hypothetical protein K8823_839 [Cenarchaeum symbiont of Oopsacas minuta]|nr:hypothetical protein [Cenarchaeum symbiont of Oopsacas minuta]
MIEKGKYASATENRRFVWQYIVWPLVLELNDLVFTLEQYQMMRSRVCGESDTYAAKKMSRGLVSLVQKGILFKDEQRLYSIHYRLVPYMRLRAECDYSTAIREIGQS